jgi:acyl-CoA thioesterase FadM
LRYDDAYAIEVTVARVGETSYTLAFALTTAGKPAARAEIAIVCVDRQTGRSRNLPVALAELLREYSSGTDPEVQGELGERDGHAN